MKDAGGNTMVTYKKDPSINRGHVSTSEYYKYGSSLLSIKNTVADMEVLPANGNIQTKTVGADGYILSRTSRNQKGKLVICFDYGTTYTTILRKDKRRNQLL